MATDWYDPSGQGAGFYNSPQDFLFKGNDSTWYGQGPAGQQDAGQMPTMQDYMFGPPKPPDSSSWDNSAARNITPMSFGGPQPQTPVGRGGGGGGNFQYIPPAPVPVPSGPLWNRYQAVQANPAMATADPAYQFLQQQGEQALGRSAGARRMRFAGKTMLDFQTQGQGLALNNLRSVLGELRAGAGDEYKRAERNAQAYAADAGPQDRSLGNFSSYQDYLRNVGTPTMDQYRQGMVKNTGRVIKPGSGSPQWEYAPFTMQEYEAARKKRSAYGL